MSLKPAEKAFLETRREEQEALLEKIEFAEAELAPLEQEYDALQAKIHPLVEEQKKLGKQKQEVIAKHDLAELKKELSYVVKDVTRLLKKDRGA